MSTVTALCRYPVKGLAPEELEEAELAAGETIACDRIYAIENGPGRFDPGDPKPLPKVNFLMLMRNARLAALETKFDTETHTLTILRNGRQVARGALNTTVGRQMIEQFMAGYMEGELRGAPRVVHAGGHSFSDVPLKCLHIVNLASVRELERAAGRAIDPLRFRANVYFEGNAAWEEFDWIDRTLAAGGARLKVVDRTHRCEATNVEPGSGTRDMAIPALLERAFGHGDFGVYATVRRGGTLRRGDTIGPGNRE